MLRALFILGIWLGAGSGSAQFFGKETYEVGSVDELLSAIGPDRTVRLKPGTLVISNASLKKREHVGRLGYAIYIRDVKNLRIAGAKQGASQLVVEDLTLTFANCRNLELRDLKLKRSGNTPGAVIRFVSSTNSLLRNCELADGTNGGIELNQADRFELRNVTIRDCQPGILKAEASANLAFDHCRFENNGKQYGMRLRSVYGVVWENCMFANNDVDGDFFDLSAAGKLSITGGQLTGNSYQRLQTPGSLLKLKEVGGFDPKP